MVKANTCEINRSAIRDVRQDFAGKILVLYSLVSQQLVKLNLEPQSVSQTLVTKAARYVSLLWNIVKIVLLIYILSIVLRS